MSYETRMVLRLAAPGVLVFVAGIILAVAMDALGSLPVAMGGQPFLPGVGDDLALGTGVVALLVYAGRMLRYWRWTRGDTDICFVCSCLLGQERHGRFGTYRKCLGCGKKHAVGRL
ncbi:hypothetical protein FIV34_11915 [Luteibacter pinisoli]|uniref:Uncharacterized protein n=1 Tax=Luteibacter pinisoli TaxID=2589080 RepID=A0A4Y5Z4K7_9GAMM|nr:hypothetical protein [Luteibacter pinisoli]QDE39866.1 hypothetical protein FIV34_11915 [Luteibacter pinisoli]